MAEAETVEQEVAPEEPTAPAVIKVRGRRPTVESLNKTLETLEDLVFEKSASGMTQGRITQTNEQAQKVLAHLVGHASSGESVEDQITKVNKVIDALASLTVLPGEEPKARKRKVKTKTAPKAKGVEATFVQKITKIRSDRESLQRRLVELDERERKVLAEFGEARISELLG